MLVVFSVVEIKRILIALATERLTVKQKKIIDYLKSNNTEINVTATVSILSKQLWCSKSAVWNNLISLKKTYIIYCGDSKNKGIPIKLTEVGKLIAENYGKTN